MERTEQTDPDSDAEDGIESRRTLAVCRDCDGHVVVPFDDPEGALAWAQGHRDGTGHEVRTLGGWPRPAAYAYALAFPGQNSGAARTTRAEHLEWCRARALAELDDDPDGRGPSRAMTSMTSDLGKHPETSAMLERGITGMAPMGVELEMLESLAGFTGPRSGTLRTPAQVREWIGGFR